MRCYKHCSLQWGVVMNQLATCHTQRYQWRILFSARLIRPSSYFSQYSKTMEYFEHPPSPKLATTMGGLVTDMMGGSRKLLWHICLCFTTFPTPLATLRNGRQTDKDLSTLWLPGILSTLAQEREISSWVGGDKDPCLKADFSAVLVEFFSTNRERHNTTYLVRHFNNKPTEGDGSSALLKHD